MSKPAMRSAVRANMVLLTHIPAMAAVERGGVGEVVFACGRAEVGGVCTLRDGDDEDVGGEDGGSNGGKGGGVIVPVAESDDVVDGSGLLPEVMVEVDVISRVTVCVCVLVSPPGGDVVLVISSPPSVFDGRASSGHPPGLHASTAQHPTNPARQL